MAIYQLDYILHEPEESEGRMYLAEAPALQGCMAWGDTPEETLLELLDVARMIIELRKEWGEPIPEELPRPLAGNITIGPDGQLYPHLGVPRVLFNCPMVRSREATDLHEPIAVIWQRSSDLQYRNDQAHCR